MGPLFDVLHKEENSGDFILPQNGRRKKWCIRTDEPYCMSEYFPKGT